MKTIAAVYGRVSTPQQEQEATIESQVAAIETYAEQQGYGLHASLYFLDQAVSGAQLARPQLDQLRDQASEQLFAVVLCLSPDRLARHYAHQWLLLDELQRVGVKVIFVNQPPIDESPQGQLLLGVQGLFAEYERALISERLRRGKLYRIRQGQLVSPVAPYGYCYIPVHESNGGRWAVNEGEARVVRQIYDWYVSQALTIHQLLQRLQDAGAQAPARGKRWQFSTVQAILKRRDYTGKAYYNQTQACHDGVGQPKRHGRGPKQAPVRVLRPSEEWIPVQVPPLISEEIWLQAQERLAMNHKFAQRNNHKHFYLLRSLLVCSHCGHSLVGRTALHSTTYACPYQSGKLDPTVASHRCAIDGTLIETLIWQAVSALLQNPTLLADAWQQPATSTAVLPDEQQSLLTRQRTLERQWQRILDLFQEEQIDKTEFAKRKQTIDHERQTIEQRLARFDRFEQQRSAKAQMLTDFTAFCQQINAALAEPTPQVRQDVIRLLIDHIIVSELEIIIKHILPTDDDCRLLPGRRLTQI